VVSSQRLPEVDRIDPGSEVTSWFPGTFLLCGGLSPAVSGEESGWVLRVERDWSFVSDWGERAGSGALSVFAVERCRDLDVRGVYRKSTGRESGR